MEDSVQTLGVDLRTRFKRFGAKEKTRRKKSKVRFSIIKRNKSFRRNVEGTCSEDGSYGEISTEKANGSSSGQKEHDLFVLVHGSFWSPSTGQKVCGLEDGAMDERELGKTCRQVRGPAGAVMSETRELGIK